MPEPVAPPAIDLTTPVRRSKRPRVENAERQSPFVEEIAATSNKKDRGSKKPAAGEPQALMTGALPADTDDNNNSSSAQVPIARTPSAQVPRVQANVNSATNEDIVPHRPGTTRRAPFMGNRDLSDPPNPPLENCTPARQKIFAASNDTVGGAAADGTGRTQKNLDEIEIDKKAIGYI